MQRISLAPTSILRRLGASVLMAGTASAGPVMAAPGDALLVAGDVVNVRTKPTTTSLVELRVFEDQLVVERAREGDWVRVEIAGSGGLEGWIHGSLLTLPGGTRLAEPLVTSPPAAPGLERPVVPAERPAPPIEQPPMQVASSGSSEPAAGGPIEPMVAPAADETELVIAPAITLEARAPAEVAPAAPPAPGPAPEVVATRTVPDGAAPAAAPAPPTQPAAPAGAAPDVAALPIPPAAGPAGDRIEPAAIEPAAAPALSAPPDVERFREAVAYLNTRALAVAGVDLFTGAEPVSQGTVRVAVTDAWGTIPRAGRESYLNALVDRWAAVHAQPGPATVQIVDATGDVMAERSLP